MWADDGDVDRRGHELDMDLDDALREAAAALADEGASENARPYPQDFDPAHQYWPSSAHINNTATPRQHIPPVRTRTEPAGRRDNYQIMQSHAARVNNSLVRVDLAVRNILRDIIFSALMSDAISPSERVAMLEDCRASAEESSLGIPFREILSEPMEPLGVPPLMYELMNCKPDRGGINDEGSGTGMEMVLYLIEHWKENLLDYGKMGILSWVVQTACLRRFDEEEGNILFQQLRPTVFEKQHGSQSTYVDYDISVSPLRMQGDATGGKANDTSPDFSALISLPDFASRLLQVHDAAQSEHPHNYDMRVLGVGRKPLPPDLAHSRVSVDFLTARRAWRLEIDSNTLKLELVDGPGGSLPCGPADEAALFVDARVKIVEPDQMDPAPGDKIESNTPVELLFPRALLRPISASGRGTHFLKLSPCFSTRPLDYDAPRGFDDARFLHDHNGALLLELTVRFTCDPFWNPSRAPVQIQRREESIAGPSGVARGTNEDDDLYVTDDLPFDLGGKMGELSLEELDGWEEVSQMDETEEKEGGWVKASWSGKDEEL